MRPYMGDLEPGNENEMDCRNVEDEKSAAEEHFMVIWCKWTKHGLQVLLFNVVNWRRNGGEEKLWKKIKALIFGHTELKEMMTYPAWDIGDAIVSMRLENS